MAEAAAAAAAPEAEGAAAAKAKAKAKAKAGPEEAPASHERVVPIGFGGRQLRPKYACDPKYLPVADCFCVRFSPDDEHLASSYANGAIHIYSADTGKQVHVLNPADDAKSSAEQLPTTQLRWKPHSKSVLMSVSADIDGQICSWNVKTGKCLHMVKEEGNQIFCLDCFSEGYLFATAGKDRYLRVYDEATQKLVHKMTGGEEQGTVGHSNRIFSLKFHPKDSNILLSGGWDNTVQIWDTRKGHPVRSIWGCYICGDSVDFSTDGRQVLTGSNRSEKALQIWDFGSGELEEVVDWRVQPSDPTAMLFAAQFSKDPSSILIGAGGGQDNEAKFFTRENGKAVPFGALVGLPKPVFTLDIAPSSHLAAVGSADGQVRVLEIR